MPDIAASDFVEVIDDSKKYFLAHIDNVYSCTCDEWKNQTRINESRRTCRHLKSYRGEKEEQMRVDPLGPPPSLPPEFLKSPSSTARQHGTSNSSELTAKEEDYDDEFDAQISSWSVVVPYEADISSALQKARQREFANHFSTWASIEEATIEATGTILDIKYVTNDGPPGMCTTCPLPSKTLESVFGTNKPTEKVLQQKTQRAITRLLLKEWWLDDSPEFCLQSYYVVLYEKRGADLTPSKIAFAGWSDNC